MSFQQQPIVRVGIIGCGEISQVAHIPTFCFLSDYFQITYLSDVSQNALDHCKKKVPGAPPKVTLNAHELCASTEVDAILVATSDEYHAEHAIAALKNNKHVLLEKPMTLNQRDAHSIIETEANSKGRVMVGYMRRYAPAFEEAVKLVGGMEKILYARVRDIIGPNSAFVSQSGTFPKQFDDYPPSVVEDKALRATTMVDQGLRECDLEATPGRFQMWRLLGGLGSHDLSAMRELLGMPKSCLGASLGTFWTALFQYPGFAVTYESGIDAVPRFDAHLEVYSKEKSVKVTYDSPYVKGLPTTMTICEKNGDGGYKETFVRRTYEDPYTIEFKKFHDFVVNGAVVKTTSQDALKDLEIFQMIMKAGGSSI
jgi:predicted dehydrogenase